MGKTLAFYKEDLLYHLHQVGIPDTSVALKEYKKNPKGNLGAYKDMSQFTSNPIIRLDIEAHEKTLAEMEDKLPLDKAIMETLTHEYGHVIEEFIRVDARQQNNPIMLNKLLSAFPDMEDFAEKFGHWASETRFVYENQELQEITQFYAKKVFTQKALEWVEQPHWKRVMDSYLEKNAHSYEKCATSEGSFNKCRQVSEALGTRLAQMHHMDVKILRLSDYGGFIEAAHPKWLKIGAPYIVHYAVLLNNEHVVDMTARQFDPKADFPMITKKENLAWGEIEIFHAYTPSQKKMKLS